MNSEFRLRVGESAKLAGFWLEKKELVYTGMPNDRVYSVAVRWTSGYRSVGYNLFIPLEQDRLELYGGRLTVYHVDSEGIRFRFDR